MAAPVQVPVVPPEAMKKRTNYLSWDDYVRILRSVQSVCIHTSLWRSLFCPQNGPRIRPLRWARRLWIWTRKSLALVSQYDYSHWYDQDTTGCQSGVTMISCPGRERRTVCWTQNIPMFATRNWMLFWTRTRLMSMAALCLFPKVSYLTRSYVALFPCNECAKLIIQSGIKHVVYVSDKVCSIALKLTQQYSRELPYVASRRLLDMAGITLRFARQCLLLCAVSTM